MPLYDFACPQCGTVFEDMAALDELTRPCPACSRPARRLLSVGPAYRADAPWLESVTAVAERDSGKAHVEAFRADPNRTTYRNWMRGEGIRPLEAGEDKRPALNRENVRREVLARLRTRRGHL